MTPWGKYPPPTGWGKPPLSRSPRKKFFNTPEIFLISLNDCGQKLKDLETRKNLALGPQRETSQKRVQKPKLKPKLGKKPITWDKPE